MDTTDETSAEDTQRDDVEIVSARGRTTIDGWTGWSPGKLMLAVVVAASFGLWAYAYSGFADRTPPDTFDNPSFAQRAEIICATSKARYDEVPNALAAKDETERAGQIRQGNLILQDMVDQLEAEVSGTERDRGIAILWLDRWRILLADRADFADRLEDDPTALFYISREAGFRAEKSIDYVANTNDMPSCTLPDDVG